MSMKEWAEREIKIACDSAGDDLCLKEVCESAFKVYSSLIEDGHSGLSINMTKMMLNRLIDGKPLSPIKGNLEDWNKVSDETSKDHFQVVYQCKRMSSLFKTTTFYSDKKKKDSVEYSDINRCYGIDKYTKSVYSSGLLVSILDNMYPIKLPYMPATNPYSFVTEDFLFDREHGGDLDTLGIYILNKPDGSNETINRWFKEDPNTGKWVEINRKEFLERKEESIMKCYGKWLKNLTREECHNIVDDIREELAGRD